jgi:hypothetical protein
MLALFLPLLLFFPVHHHHFFLLLLLLLPGFGIEPCPFLI